MRVIVHSDLRSRLALLNKMAAFLGCACLDLRLWTFGKASLSLSTLLPMCLAVAVPFGLLLRVWSVHGCF